MGNNQCKIVESSHIKKNPDQISVLFFYLEIIQIMRMFWHKSIKKKRINYQLPLNIFKHLINSILLFLNTFSQKIAAH